jgi:hypothetical protein
MMSSAWEKGLKLNKRQHGCRKKKTADDSLIVGLAQIEPV